MDAGKSNAEKLYEAGIVITDSLPDPYREVVENLSDREVELLISLKEALDRAEAEGSDVEEELEMLSIASCFVL